MIGIDDAHDIAYTEELLEQFEQDVIDNNAYDEASIDKIEDWLQQIASEYHRLGCCRSCSECRLNREILVNGTPHNLCSIISAVIADIVPEPDEDAIPYDDDGPYHY